LLSTLRTTENQSLNTVAVCPRMYFDTSTAGESCRNVLAETTVNSGVEVTGTATFHEINGLNGEVILDAAATINSAGIVIAGVKGEIRGTGTQTAVDVITCVEAKYNNAINPTAGDSALFYGWSHVGVVDYGLLLKSSGTGSLTAGISIGATTTGIALTGISGAGGSDMDTGQIVIAADASGTPLAYGTVDGSYVIERTNVTAGLTGVSLRYLIGKYDTYTTSSVFTNGMIMGTYQKITLDHTTLETNAVRGRICIDAAQTGDTSNQHTGVIGQCELAAVAIASKSTGLHCGVRGMASSESGCTANAPMNGGYFSTDAKSNIVGEVSAIKARMIGYTDYGLKMHVFTSNATSGICIQTDESSVLPAGIEFTNDSSGSITNAFSFLAAGTAPVSTTGTSPIHGATAVKIAIAVNDVTYYLLASTAPTT